MKIRAIPHRFDAIRDLDDPARGIGIGEGLPLDEFHAAIVLQCMSPSWHLTDVTSHADDVR
jgi:hypothetical protein